MRKLVKKRTDPTVPETLLKWLYCLPFYVIIVCTTGTGTWVLYQTFHCFFFCSGFDRERKADQHTPSHVPDPQHGYKVLKQLSVLGSCSNIITFMLNKEAGHVECFFVVLTVSAGVQDPKLFVLIQTYEQQWKNSKVAVTKKSPILSY
jgi:hypothetical protein